MGTSRLYRVWFVMMLVGLAPAGISCQGCGASSLEQPESYSDRLLSSGTPRGMARSTRGDVLISVGGVFAAFGGLFAMSPDGRTQRWVVELPDTPTAPVVSPEGTIYVGVGREIMAFTPAGERLPFSSEADTGSISLGGHGGLLVRLARGGLVALARDGGTLSRTESEDRVFAIGVGRDGRAHAITEADPLEGELSRRVHLRTWDRNLNLLWSVELGIRLGGVNDFLALGDESIYVSERGLGSFAFSYDGELRWHNPMASGPIVVGAGERVVVGRHELGKQGQIARTFESEQVLQSALDADGHLWATAQLTDSIGALINHHLRFDAQGDVEVAASTFSQSFAAAPLLQGGEAVFVGGLTRMLTSFPEEGGIAVKTGSESYVQSYSGAPALGAGPWPRSGTGNLENTGRLPQAPSYPLASELYGTWVWQEGRRVLAIEFAREAPRFAQDLLGERVYGVYDYTLPELPKLIQVGTWELESEDELTLKVARAAASENQGRTLKRRMLKGMGELILEDPLSPKLARTYRRAGRLPGPEALVNVPQSPIWLYSSDRYDMATGSAIVGLPDGGAKVIARYADYLLQGWKARIFNPESGFALLAFDSQGAPGQLKETSLKAKLGPQMFAAPDGDVVLFGDTWDGKEAGPTVLKESASGLELLNPQSPTLHRTLRDVLRTADGQFIGVGEDFDEMSAGVWWHDATGALTSARVFPQVGALKRASFRRIARLSEDEVVVLGVVEAGVMELGAERVAPQPFRPGNVAARTLPTSFLAILDARTGDPIKSTTFAGDFTPTALAVGVEGEIFVAGQAHRVNMGAGYHEASDFDGFNREVPLPDAVLAQFSSELELQWFSILGSRSPISVAQIDPFGTITLGGRIQGTQLGERAFASTDKTTAILQIERCGRPVHAISAYGGWGIGDIDVDASGRIFATGEFLDDVVLPDRTLYFEGLGGNVGTGASGTPNPIVFSYQGVTDEFADASGAPHTCAKRQPTTLSLTVSPRGLGEGRVVSEPAGIDCPGTCTARFKDLSEVRLMATAGPTSQFMAFETVFGGELGKRCEGANPSCAWRLIKDQVVEAWFHTPGYEVIATTPEGIGFVSMAADKQGRVVALVNIHSPLTFAGTSLTHDQTSALLGWNAKGEPEWALAMGGVATAVKIQPETSQILVMGREAITRSALTVLFEGVRNYDMGLLRVSPEGVPEWGARLPGDSSSARFVADMSAQGEIVMSSIMSAGLELGGVSFEETSYYIVKLSPQGEIEWVKDMGMVNRRSNDVRALNITLKPSGGVQLQGDFFGDLIVEGMTLATSPPDGLVFFALDYDEADGSLEGFKVAPGDSSGYRIGHFDEMLLSREGVAGYFGQGGLVLLDAQGEYQMINMSIDVPYVPNLHNFGRQRKDGSLLIPYGVSAPNLGYAVPKNIALKNLGVSFSASGEVEELMMYPGGLSEAPQNVGAFIGEDEALYGVEPQRSIGGSVRIIRFKR